MDILHNRISAPLRHPHKGAAVFFVACALVSGLLSALLFFVPLALDDLWFLDGIHTPPGPDTFSAACEILQSRLSTDTGRLGAIISPLFLALFPKFVYNILTGLVFFLLVLGSCRLANVRSGGLWSYLILAFCTIGLPWYDYLLILTYGINYIWAAAAAVWAAVVMLAPEKVKGRFPAFCALVLCFVAGWMHEGFGIPLSAAALVTLIGPKKKTLRLRYFLAMAAGTAMTALSPAIWNRLFYTTSTPSPDYPLTELIIHFGPLAAILILYFATLLCTRLFSRKQIPSENSVILFFTTFITVATAIALLFYCGPRITTPAILFTGIATIRLLSPRLPRLPRIISKSLSILILLFLILHLAAAITLQKRLLTQFHRIERLFSASPSGDVYIDLIEPRPDLTLFKTTVRQFHEFVPREMFSRYYTGDNIGKQLTVLPTVLRGFEPGKARLTASTPGLCIYRRALVALTDAPPYPSKGIIELTDASGRVILSRYRTQTFTISDGRTCTLITPHASILDPTITIVDARFP